jgi:FkbM family methyltransferase
MDKIKTIIKKLFGVHEYSGYTPLHDLISVGYMHGFYMIPGNFLNENSVCYCIGAGIDISFDTELVVKYKSKVFIFDPMPEGKNHYNALKEALANGKTLTVGADQLRPFKYRITNKEFDTIQYLELGIWDEATKVKFYEPTRENYASHSILNLQNSEKYIEASVDRISNVMKRLGHNSIDLVKIEIEGAEYRVIETIVEDKIDIKIIVVEYDEIRNHSNFSYLWRIKKSTRLLLNSGYIMAYSNSKFKRTFIKKEVYDELKMRKT